MKKCKRLHIFFQASNKNVGVVSLSNYGIIVILLTLTLGCSSNNTTYVDENTLAQINDHSVTVAHFETAFKEYYFRTGQVLTPDETVRKAILDSEFNTYVMAVYAQDIGLDKTAEAEYQRSAIEKRVLTEEYLNQVILSGVEVTDADLRDYYIRFNSNLRASHIYAATKELADDFYERLQNGENFESLAQEAFINPYLAENGGDIGRFTTDDLDVAFEDQAFSMEVGEISRPVKTAQGYSIIKLTDRVTKPILTEYEFNQNKERLTSYVRVKKEEIEQREHLQSFIDESVINDVSLGEIFELIATSADEFFNRDVELINKINSSIEILSFDTFTFNGKQFSDEILSSSISMLNTIQDEQSFRNFIYGVAYRAFMVDQALTLEIDQQPAVVASIQETYLHYLEKEAESYLTQNIENTPAELYDIFYQKSEDFYEPEQIRVQRLVVNGEEFANEIYSNLMQGEDFSTAVVDLTKYNEDIFTQGDLGYVPITDFGFNARKLSATPVGELVEPINYTSDEYHIYKVLDRIDARDLTFDEAKEMVDRYLTNQKLQQLRAETIQQVKEKHNAVVDLEKLNALTIKI